MFVIEFKRFALIVALAASAVFPQLAAAQSDPNAEDQDAPAMVEDAAPVEAPALEPVAPAVAASPDWQWRTNTSYLGRLRQIRSNWIGAQYDIDDMARRQRLGTMNPAGAQALAQRYPAAVDTWERQLPQAAPAPQFARVQELHVAAAAEFRLAMTFAILWLDSGPQSALADAQGHFARLDWILAQALAELR